MRSPTVASLLLLVAALGAALWFGTRGDAPELDGALDGALDGVLEDGASMVRGEDAEGRPVLVRQEADRDPGAKDGQPSPRPAVRIRYRLVDAGSRRPIAGARILAARDGQVLGTTGDDGIAEVEGGAINAVVFAAEGYLLEHYFDRPAQARILATRLRREGVAEVPLQLDDLTVRFRLAFVTAAGGTPADVEFRITCLEDPVPDGRDVPTQRMGAGAAVPEELREAWGRHLMLATLDRPRFAAEPLHFGRQSHATGYACAGHATLRFVAAGAYRVDARGGDEFRRQSIEVVHEGEARIELRAGGHVEGQVVARSDRQPIAQAAVALRYQGSLVTSDLTGADGRFRLGPLAPNTMVMEVHHPAFEPVERAGTRVGEAPLVIELTALPEHTVTGTVRGRPALRAIAGARVRFVSGDGVVAETRTDAQGRFDLRSYLIEPTLEIEADGFLAYAESLNANGVPRDFELIPGSVEERLRLGLTSLVTGTVLDEQGRPAANRPVHVQPVNPRAPDGFDGRRILRGGRLADPTMVITGADGGFALEWPRSEAVRLHAVKGIAGPEDGTVVTAVLGRRHQVVLRDPR